MEEHLAGPQESEILHPLLGERPAADEEAAGREIEEGAAPPCLALPDERGQEVLLLAVEQAGIADRARGDHPGHLAADEPLGLGRVLDLVADRHLEPGREQLGEIGLQRVVGHAAHRRLVLAAPVWRAVSWTSRMGAARRASSKNISKKSPMRYSRMASGCCRLDLQVLAQHGGQSAEGEARDGGGGRHGKGVYPEAEGPKGRRTQRT